MRLTFGGTAADFIFRIKRAARKELYGPLFVPPSITMWDAATGGVQYIDLLYAGAPANSIPLGGDGAIPEFLGPDTSPETRQMWADKGWGPRVLLITNERFVGPKGDPGPSGGPIPEGGSPGMYPSPAVGGGYEWLPKPPVVGGLAAADLATTAAAGTSEEAARADHVHRLPTLNGLRAATGDVTLSGFKATNLGAPTTASDAARLDTVRTAVYGDAARTARPFARIFRTTNQTIPASTTTNLAFDATDEETDSTFGDHTNNQLVAPIAGLYLVELYVPWAGNNSGLRYIDLLVGGSAKRAQRIWPATANTAFNTLTMPLRASAGHAITARAAQTSGAGLDVLGSANVHDQTSLSALWVAP
jgi:hypothetical protein